MGKISNTNNNGGFSNEEEIFFETNTIFIVYQKNLYNSVI